MQISNSKNNQASFGIKSVKFDSWGYSKKIFDKSVKNIQPEALKEMWKEIGQIKPKKGPDIDVYVGIASDPFCKDSISNYLYCKEGTSFKDFGNTQKSIKKAFKDLVNIVDKNRKNNVKENIESVSFSKKVNDWISDSLTL